MHIVNRRIRVCGISLGAILVALGRPRPYVAVTFRVSLLRVAYLMLSGVRGSTLHFHECGVPRRIAADKSSDYCTYVGGTGRVCGLHLTPDGFDHQSTAGRTVLDLRSPSLL